MTHSSHAERVPDFFLIGAPKSGTTSVAHYLREHPRIHLSDPKEPFYLADDLRPLSTSLGISSQEDYMSLFACGKHVQACGEASTLYLSSLTAIDNIVRMRRDAKIIVFLRDPIEVAHAFHMQQVFSGRETETDFEAAWRLIDRRRDGVAIPSSCDVPRLLFYDQIASFGSQLEALFDRIPQHQILIVGLGELKKDPKQIYARLLDFLGVENDGRIDFGRSNEAMVARNRWLRRSLMKPGNLRAWRKAKTYLPDPVIDVARRQWQTMTKRPAKRDPISDSFRVELDGYFSAERATCREVLGERADAILSSTA